MFCAMDNKNTSKLEPRTGSRLFVLTAVVILAITGMAKVWTGFGSSKLLAVVDPFFGVSFGHLMFGVGIAELAIALFGLFSKQQTVPLALVAWIATNFAIYRFGLWAIGWHRPCNCLGNLTDALHISPVVADNIMKVVLIYLLSGSYGLLFKLWKQRHTATPNALIEAANN